MSFRHPMEPFSDPIEGVARVELLEARKHLMKVLRAVDGDGELLSSNRFTVRHLILQAVPMIDSAHIMLGGENDEQR